MANEGEDDIRAKAGEKFYVLQGVERAIYQIYGQDVSEVAVMMGKSFSGQYENTALMAAIFHDDAWAEKQRFEQVGIIKKDLITIARKNEIPGKMNVRLLPVSVSEYNALNGSGDLPWGD